MTIMSRVAVRFSIGILSVWMAACVQGAAAEGGFSGQLADLEKDAGGRLGVVLLDTGSGRRWSHRADERFALCSTFKVLLAATVLARARDGKLSLAQSVPYGPSDLQSYGPVTRAHVDEGAMTVSELTDATLRYSDNTAANLLLARVGGPAGVTRFVRGLGDDVTRLDRIEPALNSNIPGDPRDTTTPAAMADTLRRITVGTALDESSRRRLLDWMVRNTTGDHRIRAGLDTAWKVGDKTGGGERGATNDVAIIWPPHRAPLILVVYYSGSEAPLARREAVVAEVARRAASVVGGRVDR